MTFRPLSSITWSTQVDSEPAGTRAIASMPPFYQDALCAQTDPERFFPDQGRSSVRAKRICASCPVQRKCLEYALAHDERYGVWGGATYSERREMRRRVS